MSFQTVLSRISLSTNVARIKSRHGGDVTTIDRRILINIINMYDEGNEEDLKLALFIVDKSYSKVSISHFGKYFF